jgi:hypothetical protein
MIYKHQGEEIISFSLPQRCTARVFPNHIHYLSLACLRAKRVKHSNKGARSRKDKHPESKCGDLGYGFNDLCN